MRKTSDERADQSGSRTFPGGVRVLMLAFCAAVGVVAAPLNAQPADGRTQCGAQHETSFQLDQNWEQVDLQQPGVVCTFRNKNGGFPTLTVTWEGPLSSSTSASPAAYADSIIQSYQRVGLTDARVVESGTRTHDTRDSSFQAIVSYTTRAIPMMAIIVVSNGATRSFTLTLLDTADKFQSSRPRLEAVAGSFRVSGGAARPQYTPRVPMSVTGWAWITLAAVVVTCAIFAFLMYVLRR